MRTVKNLILNLNLQKIFDYWLCLLLLIAKSKVNSGLIKCLLNDENLWDALSILLYGETNNKVL